jgi:NADPH:quinone reductase-like Zn-dependent oxidoreductase
VFGARTGAFADYVCIGPSRLAKKPPGVSFEQAAGVPVAALTALQGLRDHGKVKPGQTVLINGASGGVGTYAVQIAKSMGAEVTGVCSGRNVELVRRLGADHVVDYTKEDFTKGDRRYDVILDNVGNRSASECRRVLAPEGIYVLIGGGGPGDHVIAGPLLKLAGLAITSPFRKQKMRMMLARVTHEDLAVMADLMQSGKVTTVVDRTYNLGRLPEALAYLETGRARGKVIVTID